MAIFMTLLYIFVLAGAASWFYFTQTRKGREQNAHDSLSEAQSVSKMADAHITARRVQKATTAKLEEAGIDTLK